MISDEERRGIAEGLRIAVASSPHAYATDLWAEMGVDVGDGIMAKADVLRVAELIDRPVCHPASVPLGPCGDTVAGCSVCGEPLMLNAYTKPPSYYPRCAKCGSEVVG